MKYLSLDLETFSSENLSKAGVYRYVQAPDFDILLISYAIDGGEVQTIDLAQGEAIPLDLISTIISDDVIKWAYNAQFERICLSEWLKRKGYCLERPVPFGLEPEYLNYLNRKLALFHGLVGLSGSSALPGTDRLSIRP